jgi:hypothetical protein
MRAGLLLLAFVSLAVAQRGRDPVRLEVTENGNVLSYKIVNLSPNPIIGFEVQTRFTSGGFEHLGCGVNAEVKSLKDLLLKEVCTLPRDAATGKAVSYSVSIVRVNFANGLTWTPGQ